MMCKVNFIIHLFFNFYIYFRNIDFTKAYEEYNSEFEKAVKMKRKVEEKRAISNIVYVSFCVFSEN